MRFFKDKGPIIILMLITMFLSSGGVFAADPTSETPESATARQLRINKNVLLQGPTVENRNDAAMELLLSSDPQARAGCV